MFFLIIENEQEANKTDKTKESDKDYVKSLLKEYSFAISDDSFKSIISSADTDPQMNEAIKDMKKVYFYEKDKVRNSSKFIIFLITKHYLDSKLFQEDLKTASQLNKEIILIINEEDSLDFDVASFKMYKIFKIEIRDKGQVKIKLDQIDAEIIKYLLDLKSYSIDENEVEFVDMFETIVS